MSEVLKAISTLVCLAAAVVAILRWVRVSQREHYISGSCIQVFRRWSNTRPPNAILEIALLASLGALLVTSGSDTILVYVGSVLISAAALVVPWGMPIFGEPKLAFTRRAKTLLGLSVIVSLAVWAFFQIWFAAVAALAAVVVVVPFSIDIAAMIAEPIEKRALETHRRKAAKRLNHVNPFIIAVTGSWGKTSTKNHIRDLLSSSSLVVASPASFNNTAGLSRTMNEHLTEGTEVLVAEMGMYGPGEIREMCSWVKPNVAVICAVGPMHLERAGSVENIAKAKAEILERAETGVLWVDNEHLAKLADQVELNSLWRVGTKGSAQNLDVVVEVKGESAEISNRDGVLGSFDLASGLHPGNVACAVAAALAYGATSETVSKSIGTLTNPEHRSASAVNDKGVTVIDDTFNSNPVGAAAAVVKLAETVSGRRVVVTPGMVELGPEQFEANRAFAAQIATSGAELVAVGWTNRKALVAGFGEKAVIMPNRVAARDWVRANLGSGDGVLWENDLPDHYA